MNRPADQGFEALCPDSPEQPALADVLVEREKSLLEANQKLAAIYNASADGLALCRAIRNDDGVLVDYQVLEVNKAHSELTGATREAMLATAISKVAPPVKSIWFESAERVLRTRMMEHFDIRSPATGRWLNVRVSYVAPELIQQTFIDITDRYLLEEQRRHLVDEMNHRVMNNFQMVAGLLHLQSKNAEPVVRRELEKAQSRVQVLARFHAMLAATHSDGEVDMPNYITALCDQLRGMIDRPELVTLHTELAPLVLRSERAVPLVFVLNELVTNALKYAFPPPRTGTVTVRLFPRANDWVLSVADDGIGLSADCAGTPAKSHSGLGTRLVAAFVQQLEATLVTTPGAGLRHEITFRP